MLDMENGQLTCDLTTKTHPFSSGPSRREPGILVLGFSHGRSHEKGCAIAPEYPAIQNNMYTSVIIHVHISKPLKHSECTIHNTDDRSQLYDLCCFYLRDGTTRFGRGDERRGFWDMERPHCSHSLLWL